MGEKAFTALTDQGHVRRIVAGVTDVDDALLEHQLTGEVTPLIEQRGLYKLKMWVPKNQSYPF